MIYLNGIRMGNRRECPAPEANKFIKQLMADLLSPNDARKHKCSDNCDMVWTVAIGKEFTTKNDFMECVPRFLNDFSKIEIVRRSYSYETLTYSI